MFYAGEKANLSLLAATGLWKGLVNIRESWTASTLRDFHLIFWDHINSIIDTIDLSYKTIISEEKPEKMELEGEIPEQFSEVKTVEFIANNQNDQQFYYRLVLLLGILSCFLFP